MGSVSHIRGRFIRDYDFNNLKGGINVALRRRRHRLCQPSVYMLNCTVSARVEQWREVVQQTQEVAPHPLPVKRSYYRADYSANHRARLPCGIFGRHFEHAVTRV